MGNSAIYYWPEDDGPMQTLDFGERISDMGEVQIRNVQVADAADLEPSGVDYGGRRSVRIVLERFSSYATYNKLITLENHLQRGLPIGFAVDTAKAWAGYKVDWSMSARESSIQTSGNAFNYASLSSLSADDWIEISSSNPERKVQRLLVDSYSSGLVTLDSSTKTAWTSSGCPIFVRHVDFFPVLYLHPSQYGRPIVTHDHRINYTLDLELVDAPGIIDALYTLEGDMGLNLTEGDIDAGSLQGVINTVRQTSGGLSTSGVYLPPGGVFGGGS